MGGGMGGLHIAVLCLAQKFFYYTDRWIQITMRKDELSTHTNVNLCALRKLDSRDLILITITLVFHWYNSTDFSGIT